MKSAGLHIGTSGWSYKHWSEIFYPKDIKPDKYLEFYITEFSCVELNASFYNLPFRTTVTGWMNRTPAEFKFCTKLSRFITHQSQLVNVEEPLRRYFDVFNGMKNKTGPVLIQLPPGLAYDKSLICNFFSLITGEYGSFRFAVEVRNRSWINDHFLDLLSQYGIAFVTADSGNRYPYHEAATAGFVYLRLHGREQLYASDYSEADLKLYSEKIIKWLVEGKEVWVFFNNDYNGFAPKNAKKLMELVNIS